MKICNIWIMKLLTCNPRWESKKVVVPGDSDLKVTQRKVKDSTSYGSAIFSKKTIIKSRKSKDEPLWDIHIYVW